MLMAFSLGEPFFYALTNIPLTLWYHNSDQHRRHTLRTDATREISDELYDDDCTFTDPTISFKGPGSRLEDGGSRIVSTCVGPYGRCARSGADWGRLKVGSQLVGQTESGL